MKHKLFMVSSDTELLEASDVAGIGALDPQTDDAVSQFARTQRIS